MAVAFGAIAIVASCNAAAPLVGGPSDAAPRSLDAAGSATPISFRRDLRPLIARMGDPSGPGCRRCHYSTEASHIGLDLGGLDLSTLGALRQGGGTSGKKIVVPFHPEESAIVQKLRGTYPYGTRMPKSGPPFWSEAEIELMEAWIAQGALGSDDE